LDLKNGKEIIKKTRYNNAYSLWRVNGYQQGFRSVSGFGFGGQESASKPPQAISKTLGAISIADKVSRLPKNEF